MKYFFKNTAPPPDHPILKNTRESTQTPTIESEYGVIAFRGSTKENPEIKVKHHMAASAVKELYPEEFAKYLKFSTIRNPYDKVVSWFWHNNKNNKRLAGNDFSAAYKLFNVWVSRKIGIPKDRDIYKIDDDYVVDYFIRYEKLEDGVEELCKKLDIHFNKNELGKFKSAARLQKQPYQDYYQEKTRLLVAEAFAEEIERFSYSFY